MATPKKFRIKAEEIRPLAPNRGACYATDMITVAGLKVGFMYREIPDHAPDSGWRFLAGTESQDYADDANNWEIYDVNTIANYDPEIIPLLDAPAPSAFERDPDTGCLVETDPPEPE